MLFSEMPFSVFHSQCEGGIAILMTPVVSPKKCWSSVEDPPFLCYLTQSANFRRIPRTAFEDARSWSLALQLNLTHLMVLFLQSADLAQW